MTLLITASGGILIMKRGSFRGFQINRPLTDLSYGDIIAVNDILNVLADQGSK